MLLVAVTNYLTRNNGRKQGFVVGKAAVRSHEGGKLHYRDITNQTASRKWGQAIKSQRPLPVTNFLRCGSTSQKVPQPTKQHSHLGSKDNLESNQE